ncbi:MAG TPA: hypothetical protein VG934_03670 [Candidatus Paceibacterota bacterium]|nr:hypothetical protein [Candidatus Paceibacterota bacterium]
MHKPSKNLPTKNPRGYIALMATIIISLVLLVLVGQEALTGWHARFIVLGTEAKEQASALAEGCADQALAAIAADPSYMGNMTTQYPGGTCKVLPITYIQNGNAAIPVITTQAVVRGAYTNFVVSQGTWQEVPNTGQ